MNTQHYTDLEASLNGKNSRKLESNTSLERRANGIAVKLHATDILLFTEDGRVVLNSGGYQTVTTRDRMNTHLPAGIRVSVKSRVWWVNVLGEALEANQRFYDGMSITLGEYGMGHTVNATTQAEVDTMAEQDERNAMIKGRIGAYVAGLTQQVVTDAIADTAGDCLYCKWEWEDMADTNLHLETHIDPEDGAGAYYGMTFLIALKEAGHPEPILTLQMMASDPELTLFKRAMRKFLSKRLLSGVQV